MASHLCTNNTMLSFLCCCALSCRDQVEAYREIFKDLLSLEGEVHAHKDGLMALHASYVPSMEPTDFAAALDANMQAAMRRRK